MSIGWLTCISAVLLPHSLCRSTTANAPANRQMPIASVVRGMPKNKKKRLLDEVGQKTQQREMITQHMETTVEYAKMTQQHVEMLGSHAEMTLRHGKIIGEHTEKDFRFSE